MKKLMNVAAVLFLSAACASLAYAGIDDMPADELSRAIERMDILPAQQPIPPAAPIQTDREAADIEKIRAHLLSAPAHPGCW